MVEKNESIGHKILSGIVVAVFTGVILAGVNHLYWKNRTSFERSKLLHDRQAVIAQDAIASLNDLVNSINTYIAYRDAIMLETQDVQVIIGHMAKHDENLNESLRRSKAAATAVTFYFPENVANFSKSIIERTKGWDTGTMSSLAPDSQLRKDIEELEKMLRLKLRTYFEAELVE